MKKIISIFIILAIILITNIKNVETTKTGCQITFRDNTGYYIEY